MSHDLLSVPSLFGHGALYRFWSWCCRNYCWLAIVLWCGYCSVSFHAFVLRHLVIAPVPNTKRLPIIKCGTSHESPPKMQFSGCLWEIVTHGNQTTKGLSPQSISVVFTKNNLFFQSGVADLNTSSNYYYL